SMAFTDRDLYMAAAVLYETPNRKEPEAWKNDNLCVFIDGDRVPNDFAPAEGKTLMRSGREGFNVQVDVAGRVSSPLGPGRFAARSKSVSGGHVIELRIPLEEIDTRDGP